MDMIQIENITKDYGNSKGVFGLNLTVKKGEVMGFLGPNGAGKTTTIRQLMGFIKPNSGSVKINGLDCFEKADEIAKTLGYLPGEIAFMDNMTGMEFIKFIAGIRNIKDLTFANRLIEYFQLDATGKIKKMSKGTKQKIAIVCAFMGKSDVYILDEPTSGLDPLMQNKFLRLVMQEKQRGATVLMSSHILEETEKICDRIAIIKQGKLLTVQTAAEIKETRKKQFEIVFENGEETQKFINSFGGELTGESTVTLQIKGSVNSFIKALGSYDVKDISTHTQSLEQVFIHYYGGQEND